MNIMILCRWIWFLTIALACLAVTPICAVIVWPWCRSYPAPRWFAWRPVVVEHGGPSFHVLFLRMIERRQKYTSREDSPWEYRLPGSRDWL